MATDQYPRRRQQELLLSTVKHHKLPSVGNDMLEKIILQGTVDGSRRQ